MDEKVDFVKNQIQFYIYIVYLKLKTSIPDLILALSSNVQIIWPKQIYAIITRGVASLFCSASNQTNFLTRCKMVRSEVQNQTIKCISSNAI
jgi:hypothetical protein